MWEFSRDGTGIPLKKSTGTTANMSSNGNGNAKLVDGNGMEWE